MKNFQEDSRKRLVKIVLEGLARPGIYLQMNSGGQEDSVGSEEILRETWGQALLTLGSLCTQGEFIQHNMGAADIKQNVGDCGLTSLISVPGRSREAQNLAPTCTWGTLPGTCWPAAKGVSACRQLNRGSLPGQYFPVLNIKQQGGHGTVSRLYCI